MKCPKCDSENCEILQETYTEGKTFSGGKAILGTLMCMGPLCGFCGKGKQTKTDSYWICKECGNKWQT